MLRAFFLEYQYKTMIVELLGYLSTSYDRHVGGCLASLDFKIVIQKC